MSLDIKPVTDILANKTGHLGLALKKNSPHILMGVGIVGAVGATVLACQATLKVDGVLDEANESLEKIRKAQKLAEDETVSYSEDDAVKDKAIVYIQSAVKLGKLYAPAIGLGAASICCILGSHYIMNKRYVSVVAAYGVVSQAFEEYRARVAEELGTDKDREFRSTKVVEETREVKKKDGTVQEKKERKLAPWASQYARFFDEASPYWERDAEANKYFLTIVQNQMNDQLMARGHLFLNEVYDALGVPRSKAGAVVGWVLGNGDDFVDFGMFDPYANERKRDFVNGYEKSILLDFNVDGVIYDLI